MRTVLLVGYVICGLVLMGFFIDLIRDAVGEWRWRRRV